MRFRTSVRASSALWAGPFALFIPLYYYYGAGSKAPVSAFGHVPTITSTFLYPLYGVAYAFAASLSCWESGRLRHSGIWQLAPARSRYRVAANALLPVLGLAWFVLLLPTVVALAEATAMPTLDSLRLQAMALLVCVGHTVFGFAVGLRAPRMIAAPLLAVAVWILVAFSGAQDPPWLRHVSGQYATDMMFGEVASFTSLLPPLLLTGGLAAGVALLWSPVRSRVIRCSLAGSLAVAGPVAAYQMAHEWDYNPPLLTGRAAMSCLGHSPRVCMPEATADDLPKVRRDALAVLRDLRAAGVDATPDLMVDRIFDGRFSRPSTSTTWRIGLTSAAQRGSVRFVVLGAAVRFPCPRPDPTEARPAMLWAAEVTGQEEEWRKRVSQEFEPGPENTDRARDSVEAQVAAIRKQPAAQQGSWYRDRIRASCSKAS